MSTPILKPRRGSLETMSTTKANLVLQSGELFEERQPNGSYKFKIGDGVTQYSELPYSGGEDITVDSTLDSTSENPIQNKTVTTALNGKQDTLTFDNEPTSGSNNVVKSSGVYNKFINSNEHKNYLPNMAKTQTINGVEFVVFGNGEIKVNGTATADIYFVIFQGGFNVKNEKYDLSSMTSNTWFTSDNLKLSGCPSGGSENTYSLILHQRSSGWKAIDYGEGGTVEAQMSRSSTCYILIKSGTTLTNKFFRPMVTVASDVDSDYNHYVPFAASERILTRNLFLQERESRNLLISKKFDQFTKNGVTFTCNDDGSISINGTCTSKITKLKFDTYYTETLPIGRYTFSGCPAHISDSTYGVEIHTYDPGYESYDTDSGDSCNLWVMSPYSTNLYITVPYNKTFNNFTIKPMITADDLCIYNTNYNRFYSDIDPNTGYSYYTPYAMSNRELTLKVQELEGGNDSGNLLDEAYDIVLNNSSLTFDQLLLVLQTHFYPLRLLCIGKTVTGVTNSIYTGNWKIIGNDRLDKGGSYFGTGNVKNPNTFDLISVNCVASSRFGSSNNKYNDANCTARNYLNTTFYNAFSENIKTYLKQIKQITNESDNSSHELPNITEFVTIPGIRDLSSTWTSDTSSSHNYGYGYYNAYGHGYTETDPYKYFDDICNYNNWTVDKDNALISDRRKKYGSSYVEYWTRSIAGNGETTYICTIDTNGRNNKKSYSSTYYLAPIIRFGL